MKKLKDSLVADFAVRAASYIFVFYILFLLGNSVWANYKLRLSIKKLNSQIAALEQQKKDLDNLNIYYRSDAFKELEARRKLGYKNPDEKVVVIASQAEDNNFQTDLYLDQQSLTSKEKTPTEPNWKLWLDYFTRPSES